MAGVKQKAYANTILAAPAGSGKTLAAFMVSIDCLIRERFESSRAGEKVSTGSNRHIVFKDDAPIAVRHKQEITYLCEVDEQTRWDASALLTNNPSHRRGIRHH